MTEEPSVRSWESDFKRAENEVKKKVILVQRCSGSPRISVDSKFLYWNRDV